MDAEINPFQELYVTETAKPEKFVALFSDQLVRHALPLFQPGNVVIKGTQGSGKSMLLSLLKPEMRPAYVSCHAHFPVPDIFARFVGAGINLTRSGIIDIGQRPLGADPAQDEKLFPLYFADFFNYWIVRDILQSLQFMADHADIFDALVDMKKADVFAQMLAKADCWFGYLASVDTFGALVAALESRISEYRKFNQFNIERLAPGIESTKTAVGEPIARAADCLWRSGLIPESAPLYVRVDQLEILNSSDVLRPALGNEYRCVVNKALSTRDPRVFYRIGTRNYAWQDNVRVFGTTASLEVDRDYRVIDLDDILRRRENSKTWVFPDFARDVFRRRLSYVASTVKKKENLLAAVMGPALKPAGAAQGYARNAEPHVAIKMDESWPDAWKSYLTGLFEVDKLSPILACAWLRQQEESGKGMAPFPAVPDARDIKPWERMYWKKERVRQALLQLAINCVQRVTWAGEQNILALSGANILIFVSICQHIWSAFLREQRGRPETERCNPVIDGIDSKVQAVGIHGASDYWYGKIPEQPGGNERQRFIDKIGPIFREYLRDRAMSNPGFNGFSLTTEDFVANASVYSFLTKAAEYGDLQAVPHTTKLKDRLQRVKFYLNPILSPHFQIPESHIKEPLYVGLHDVISWMTEAKIPVTDSGHLPLFRSLNRKGG